MYGKVLVDEVLGWERCRESACVLERTCWRGSVGHREEEAELGSERRGQVENLPLEINALSESVP